MEVNINEDFKRVPDDAHGRFSCLGCKKMFMPDRSSRKRHALRCVPLQEKRQAVTQTQPQAPQPQAQQHIGHDQPMGNADTAEVEGELGGGGEWWEILHV